MSQVHDARHPAHGVRVFPVPTLRVHGLSAAQARAARTPMTNSKGEVIGVMRPHMIGGHDGGRKHPTRSQRRGSHKPKPKNPVFYKPMPTQEQYRATDARRSLRSIIYWHKQLCLGRAQNVEKYMQARREWVWMYHDVAGGNLKAELIRAEQIHLKTISV